MTFSSYEMEDAMVEDEAFWRKGAMNGAARQVSISTSFSLCSLAAFRSNLSGVFSSPAPFLVQENLLNNN